LRTDTVCFVHLITPRSTLLGELALHPTSIVKKINAEAGLSRPIVTP
jgi:hypothetical protein